MHEKCGSNRAYIEKSGIAPLPIVHRCEFAPSRRRQQCTEVNAAVVFPSVLFMLVFEIEKLAIHRLEVHGQDVFS